MITKFIHLSDPHIRGTYEDGYLSALCENDASPTGSLAASLASITPTFGKVDFILITGDLVHEGGDEDYALFRDIVEKNTDCPVLTVLGNHDHASCFRRGYLGEAADREESYYYEYSVHGLRIIGLDSCIPGRNDGALSREQLCWLKDILRTPSPGGSILALHHPPAFEIKDGMYQERLANPQDLLSCIQGSDVRAILTGHTHACGAMTFGTIPHYTAGSTAFGVSFAPLNLYITTKRSLYYCVAYEHEMIVEAYALTDAGKAIYSIPRG